MPRLRGRGGTATEVLSEVLEAATARNLSPDQRKQAVDAQQLMKITPKIMHSKGCLEAV